MPEYTLRLGLCRPGYTLGDPLIVRVGLATIHRYQDGVEAYLARQIEAVARHYEQQRRKFMAEVAGLAAANDVGRG